MNKRGVESEDSASIGAVGAGSGLPLFQPPLGESAAIIAREKEFQKLLASERERSEQRKLNYNLLKTEHLKLQKDFVNLQTELKSLLEEAKKVQEKADYEISKLNQMINDKDKIIRDSKMEIDLKERLRETQQHEIHLHLKEKDELKAKIIALSSTPDSLQIQEILDHNSKLKMKNKTLKESLEENEIYYKKLQTKLESLIGEHERFESESSKEILTLRAIIENLKDNTSQLMKQLKEVTSSNKDLMDQFKESKDENQRLKREMRDLDEKHSNQMKELKSSHENRLKQVETDETSFRSQIRRE